MSWKDAFQYVKSAASNQGIVSAKKERHADDDLPMNARIGALLKLQTSPFIRAASCGSLMIMPAQTDMIIKAVSRVRLNLCGDLHRYYLETGDDHAQTEAFLQVFSDEDREVSELMYCIRLTRIIPETEDDQRLFTGEGGAGLGEKSYSLWKEQLADLGYGAAELDAVFGDGESIDYRRDAGGSSMDFVAPFSGTETRVDDAFGERGLTQKIYFMPYVREIAGGREYLLITTEIVESRNGDTSKRSIHVDLMIGLPLEIERVTVQ